jgi:hypothetical protein
MNKIPITIFTNKNGIDISIGELIHIKNKSHTSGIAENIL